MHANAIFLGSYMGQISAIVRGSLLSSLVFLGRACEVKSATGLRLNLRRILQGQNLVPFGEDGTSKSDPDYCKNVWHRPAFKELGKAEIARSASDPRLAYWWSVGSKAIYCRE